MPTIKRSLTRSEIAANLARAKKMRADGVEIQSPEEWVENARPSDAHADVEIEQIGGIHDSMVFELSSGCSGYVADLVITNQTSRTIYCRDIELRLPWEDSSFNWMRDPREEGRSSEFYRFPGRNPLEYPRNEVINHVLLEDGTLTPRRFVRGLLLATGGIMPKNLRHGQWLDPTLAIIASDHVEYAATIRLWTERLDVKPKPTMGEHNLYGEPIGYALALPVDRDHQPGAPHDVEIGKPAPGPGQTRPSPD